MISEDDFCGILAARAVAPTKAGEPSAPAVTLRKGELKSKGERWIQVAVVDMSKNSSNGDDSRWLWWI